jgi:hypothetical protein
VSSAATRDRKGAQSRDFSPVLACCIPGGGILASLVWAGLIRIGAIDKGAWLTACGLISGFIETSYFRRSRGFLPGGERKTNRCAQFVSLVETPAAFQWIIRLQTNWSSVWGACTQNNA